MTVPNVIAPLVRRHAEDAAFYWSQHDASAYSPRLTLSGLARFSHLLSAHLEGVEVAGAQGWEPALAALDRWKQPGEAFVCAHVALQCGDAVQLDALLEHVRASPDNLLRGVISALTWVPRAHALDIIRCWTGAGSETITQVAALRAVALIGEQAETTLSQPIAHFMLSLDAHVRAAACRAAAIFRESCTVEPLLHAALRDSELTVRAEAAITLGHRGQALATADADAQITAAGTLWQCVAAQVNVFNAATGWYRKQAMRRLNRWVQQLAWQAPLGHKDLPALLAFVPPRVGLHFVAYHGDPVHLPYVISTMNDPETARYAGWVWHAITGVDMQAAGMALPEPEPTPDAPAASEARLDADLGLPLPHIDAIRAYPSASLRHSIRYLLGQELTESHALDVLDASSQALRSIAAQTMMFSYPQGSIAVRGPAQVQMQSCAAMRMALQAREGQI